MGVKKVAQDQFASKPNWFWDYNVIIVDPDKTELDERTFECPCCGGHFKIDSTYLDQVGFEVYCPYNGTRIFISE